MRLKPFIYLGLRFVVAGAALWASSFLDSILGLPGIVFRAVGSGLATFAFIWFATFVAALTGFSPSLSEHKNPHLTFIMASMLSIVVAVWLGGYFALLGALLGALVTHLYFDKAV
jgi:hypothetical protein